MGEGSGGAHPFATPVDLSREISFQIGGLLVNPPMRQVSCGANSEFLEPRVMQVLVALAQADGQVVSRADLIERCWGGRVVGDNAIHRAVAKVRTLGASFAAEAFEIETITRIGYRMVMAAPPLDLPLQTGQAGQALRATGAADVVSGLSPLSLRGPGPSEPGVSRRRVMAGVAALSAAGAGGLFYALRPDPGGKRFAELIDAAELAARMDLPDNHQRGVGFLEEAVGLKPDSALAWGRLALARRAAAEYAPPDRTADAVASTQQAASRALRLDRRQPDALSALALLPHYFGDWFAAQGRMASVLDIAPDHLPTKDARDFMYVGAGRAREGASSRLTYATRESLHAGHQFRAIYAHWILGSVGEADRAAERALQLWPGHPGVWFAALWLKMLTGRPERGLTFIEDEAGRPDIPPAALSLLARCAQAMASRRPSDIAQVADELIESVRLGPGNAINAVLILNGLGEVDRAFDAAEAYLLERGPLIASVRWRPGQISVNDQRRRKTNMLFLPSSAQMRADPRFARLTEDIGLVSYWEQAGVTPDTGPT